MIGAPTVLAGVRVLRDRSQWDLHLRDGRIDAVLPHSPGPGTPPVASGAPDPPPGSASRGQGVLPLVGGRWDLGGRVVLPGFVESHLHLDKAWLGGPPGGAGLAEAIAWTTRRKAGFTVEDVVRRAGHVADLAVAHGTTAIRAHTEVDPGVGLTGVVGVLEVARQRADGLRLQLAVFPQEGLLCRPGTLELLREALQAPDTVVGGCPYAEATEEDARRHVDLVLDLAVDRDVPADLHLDLSDNPDDGRFRLADHVADAVEKRGLAGRVAIGHVTSLAAVDRSTRQRTMERLAAAGVTVTVLPATDLHLSGRQDDRNPRRGVAPVRELWAAGVRVALSSNNIRNAFTPTGRADLLDIALLTARVSHLSEQHEWDRLVDAISTVPAALLDPGTPTGLVPGAPADLVVLDTTDPDTLLLDQPTRHLVLRAGRMVAGSG